MGRRVWSLQSSFIVLLDFSKMALWCSLKLNLLSRNVPKCFWREVCGTTFSLKSKGGWLFHCTLREKISPYASLVGSGFKFIFHWIEHSPIFFKSLFKSIFEVSAFLTTEKSEVLPANNLGFDFEINHWYRLKTIAAQKLNFGEPQLQL